MKQKTVLSGFAHARCSSLAALSVFNKRILATAITLPLMSNVMPVVAEQAEHIGLEEVTVTARKRIESLQDIPIAVSAFSGEDMAMRGVTRLDDLAAHSPNMSFQNNPSFGGASNAASIYIRGIGQKEFLPTTEPGVGLYVDGVYIARSVGAILDLVDVEQVEILRGPQGTLFGRNTIGGAINITTRKPAPELGGKVEVGVGTDSARRVKASMDLPLSENLLSNISLASMTQDGYVERLDGTDLGDDDTQVGRINLLWTPRDDVEVLFSADHTRDRENGPAMSLIDINLGAPLDPQTPPMAVIHNTGVGMGTPCATPAAPLNLASANCYDLRYNLGQSKNAGTSPAFSESDLTSSSMTVTWDIDDSLTLKSISAWRDLDSEFSRDGDHSPHRISQFHDTLEQEQITQELQLLGSSDDARLNWILGAYYFDESGDNVNTLDFTVSNFRSGGEFDNTSKALFGQVTYDFTEALSMTLGLRYTDEEKSFLPDQIIYTNYFAGSGDLQLDAPFMQAGTRILPYIEKTVDIEETTPMVNLSYRWGDELMTYVSYSEGFKSGGFSQRVFPPQVAGAPGVGTVPAGTSDLDLIPDFDPEFVDVYEIGFKYDGWDNRLRINGALFHTVYDDLQVQVFTSVAPVTKNAASAKITGWELESSVLLAEGWMLDVSYGWLNPRYDDLDTAETLLSKTNEFERVAEHTGNVAVTHEVFTDLGLVTARIDWSYRSKEYMDSFNSEQIAQDAYDLVNANVSWLSPEEDWSVQLSLKNLTDEDYLITGIIGDAFQTYEGMYSRGREWSLSARYSF